MQELRIITKNSLEYQIYGNVAGFCKRRGYKDVSKQYEILEFNNRQISIGMFDWETSDSTGESVYICFICDNSKYTKKDEFEKLINGRSERHIVVILTTGKNIASDRDVEFINGSFSMIRDFDQMFTNRGITVRVVPKDEYDHVANLMKIQLTALPRISITAQEIVYSNAVIGDVIEIIYPSINAGLRDGGYRLVV
jgi:DNA-directed RNA polymerase subunit H (RpoH/RPB5)